MSKGEGYASAKFSWHSYAGYFYEVVPYDNGVWEVNYYDSHEQDKPTDSFTFNDLDADGVLEMLKSAVDFYREHKDES